jgi:hypothetical protein
MRASGWFQQQTLSKLQHYVNIYQPLEQQARYAKEQALECCEAAPI